MHAGWLRFWNESGPSLTERTADSAMPHLVIGVSCDAGYCGLSTDGTHVVIPFFFGFETKPFAIVEIPTPHILDMIFFEKLAAFVKRMKLFYSQTGSVAAYGPVMWDHDGFIENFIMENREHLAYVNGFNDQIMDRMCEYLDVVINDWNGERSSGRVSHATFFSDLTIDNALLEELANHQSTLGQMFAE